VRGNQPFGDSRTTERALAHLRRQVVRREVNERMAELLRATGQPGGELLLVCECSRPDCSERFPMSRPEYERLRSQPAHFALTPTHVALIDTVVHRDSGGYTVVAVVDELADAAIAADPRRDDTPDGPWSSRQLPSM
jgi:hypothetical protein